MPDRILSSPRLPGLTLAAASAALLLGALFFQYVVGLAPCVLCIWQRWPHLVVALLGLLSLGLTRSPGARSGLYAAAGITLLVGAGIAAFHVGVEQRWWAGTSGCGGTGLGAASIDDLRAQILAAPVVRCDEVAWSLFGISMAGYNLLISLALAAFAFLAAIRTRNPGSPA